MANAGLRFADRSVEVPHVYVRAEGTPPHVPLFHTGSLDLSLIAGLTVLVVAALLARRIAR